ncbi:MAG: phosphoenolpyruvate carboxykinase (ATP) [Aigarchaeota archaeon]|nr:phosphoenolpyruvate carboxykinase (ATP) [Candidatus Pelearchaeum maunauluense]
MIPNIDEMSIEGFKETFYRILKLKEKAGLRAVWDNPKDLLDRAKLYATQYKNGSLGWASNIWSRSAASTVIIEDNSQLTREHKILMLRVLEHVLAQGPLIKVDGYVGKPGGPVQMHTRVYVDPQFPDIAYRWWQLVFPAPPDGEPDVEIIAIPHYLGNPIIPNTNRLLMVMRFPFHNFTIITASSYQGEVKKAALTHWIYHVYKRGYTGEHAALREFRVKTVDNNWKTVVMAIWGLTGSGKSTHGMYVWTPSSVEKYVREFGINPLDYVKEQRIRNDDIIAVGEERVYGSERGSWTKTEDLTPEQEAMWNAAISPRALHENTEFDMNGNPSFAGELFQYFGLKNKNARSVIYLDDTGYFDGEIDSTAPLNTAVFLTPGYFTDYAWVKLADPAFAAKVLADGRTVGHLAQERELIGKVRFVPRYSEFTMGVLDTAHVVRFYELLRKRYERGDPIDVFQLNTTGRIVAKYRWSEVKLGDRVIMSPTPELVEVNGSLKVVGGTRPTIEETELFLLQATRGAVKWKPHPIWGEKVLIPAGVPGISQERLKELEPTTHLSMEEFKALLKSQVEQSKYWMDKRCPDMPREIYNVMDFE